MSNSDRPDSNIAVFSTPAAGFRLYKIMVSFIFLLSMNFAFIKKTKRVGFFPKYSLALLCSFPIKQLEHLNENVLERRINESEMLLPGDGVSTAPAWSIKTSTFPLFLNSANPQRNM